MELFPSTGAYMELTAKNLDRDLQGARDLFVLGRILNLLVFIIIYNNGSSSQ